MDYDCDKLAEVSDWRFTLGAGFDVEGGVAFGGQTYRAGSTFASSDPGEMLDFIDTMDAAYASQHNESMSIGEAKSGLMELLNGAAACKGLIGEGPPTPSEENGPGLAPSPDTDEPPPAEEDDASTIGAPAPILAGSVEDPYVAPGESDGRPYTEQYFDPLGGLHDYDLANLLARDGVPPDDLESWLQAILRNEPPHGQPSPSFSLDNGELNSVADPVLTFSGQFALTLTDIEVPSRGFPLRLVRVYRSGPVYFGPWGYNWDHNYNAFLRELADGSIAVWTGSLNEDVYQLSPTGFEAPLGVFRKLELLPETANQAERYELTDREGRKETFARPESWPFADRIPLARLTDRHGNAHDLAYNGEGQLKRVTDQSGRFLVFGYGSCGLLEQVEDHTGRRWLYEHDPEAEHLVAVTTPATTDWPDGLRTRFVYDRDADFPQLRHNILQVVRPDGRLMVETEYGSDPGKDDFGRVVSQEFDRFYTTFHARRLQFVPRLPDAINVPALQVEVIDPGVFSVHTFNYRGDLLDERFRLSRDGSYRLVARTARYDAQGNLIQRQEADGLTAVYTYDFEHEDPRARGNLLRFELVASPIAPAPSRILQEATYEPQFHRPKSIRDERGGITTWIYDYEEGNGNRGDVIRIEYPPATLPDGSIQQRSERFEYDTSGNLITHTTGEDTRHLFTWGVTGPSEGLLAGIVWDANGAAQSESFDYDIHGRRSVAVDGLGNRIGTTRNDLGQITSVLLPEVDGVVDEIRFQYGVDGFVVREELPRGNYTDPVISDSFIANDYIYDLVGHMRQATYGSNTENPRVVKAIHDAEGRLLEGRDALGRQTRFEYDERGLVLRRVEAAGSDVEAVTAHHYDRNGNLTALVDPAGYRFDYRYDSWDRLIRMTLPGVPETNRTRVELTLNEFDRVERLQIRGRVGDGTVGTLFARQTDYDERGRAWRHQQGDRVLLVAHDADERPIRMIDQRGNTTVLAYDGLSRIIEATDAVGNRSVQTYDEGGRLVRIDDSETLPDGSGKELLSTTIAYDARGRPLSCTDPLGRTTQHTHDARDLPVEEVDPLGRTVTRRFGLLGELAETSAEATQGVSVVHRFEHDLASRCLAYIDPDGGKTRFEYDPRDRRTAIIYPDGRRHSFAFGLMLHTDSELTPGGTAISYAYGPDADLRRIKFVPGPGVAATADVAIERDGLRRAVHLETGGVVVERGYDEMLRLLRETIEGRTCKIAYDDVAGTARFTYPNGRVDLLEFDPLGRLSSITLETGGPLLTGTLDGGTVLARFIYRGPDRLARREALGVSTNFEYDAGGRLAAIVHSDPNDIPIATMQYVADAVDARRFLWAAPLPQTSVRFDYDNLGRLTEGSHGVDMPQPSVPLTQAEADATIAAATTIGSTGSESYVVTRGDARTERTRVDGSTQHDVYSLSVAHEITQLTRTGEGAGVWPFIFDEDGRCVQDHRHRYTYDALSHLVKVEDLGPSGLVLLQSYDAAGRVAERTYGGVTTRLTHFGLRTPELEDAAGNPTAQMTYGVGIDEIVLESDGSNRAVLQDAALSVLGYASTTGIVLERYGYKPFGEPTIWTPDGLTLREKSVVAGTPRFGGHPLLSVGIYDARARAYDPETGRFLQPDPLGYVDGASLYTYAHHDPVNFADPAGEVGALVGLAIVAGWGAVVGMGMNAARQTIQIHEDPQRNFSVAEMLGTGALGAVAAPLLTVAPELAPALAAWGVYGGASEISAGHWGTGTFDIATSILPFALKDVRTASWGRGSGIGTLRGLGPAATAAERFGRFAEVGGTTRNLASAVWNERFYHGLERSRAEFAVRNIEARLRLARFEQQFPGTRHFGPGLYFGKEPGNPSVPGTPAWWAREGGSTGRRVQSPAILEATVPRWRLAFLKRAPGVQLDVPQQNFPDVPQAFFPYEGTVQQPSGPAMRLGEIAQWRIFDPEAPRPNADSLWPTLLAPQVRWPQVTDRRHALK